ncbi:hypothetical protein TNCT_435701 [Trichonephila clavata]|uniref:Uncharacterized protein n=1 Tax=Trichonephila clavata TaxID=2740835 RepID=A0A8X6LM34_TRICU|nr:hypothetical protein TNCT_435701 [Trichonephila clavata]
MEIGTSSRVKASGRSELERRLYLSLVKVVSRQRFSRSGMATSDLCCCMACVGTSVMRRIRALVPLDEKRCFMISCVCC